MLRKWLLNKKTAGSLWILFLFCAFHTRMIFSQGADEQYLAGTASFMKGDYSKAIESLSIAISRNNSDARLYIKRGASYLALNETEKAADDFSEANLIEPGMADLWLARAYSAGNNTPMAIQYLKSHLSSAYRIPEDSIKKDPAFDRLQVTAEWENLWQKEWYSDSERSISDAAYYLKKKQYEQAVSLLDAEIVKNPGDMKILEARGNAFMQQGNFAAAAGDFSSVLASDKNKPYSCKMRGIAYIQTQRYKDAVADFTRILKSDPAAFDLYILRARAYAGLKEWSSAVKDMQLYLRYFDNDQKALYTCGDYYFEAQDYINALKCFNRNLKEDPNNALYYKARGKTYLMTSTFRYAVSDLAMSLDLDPNDAEAWLYHGLASMKAGNQADGCSSLNKARQLGNTEAIKHIASNCEQ